MRREASARSPGLQCPPRRSSQRFGHCLTDGEGLGSVEVRRRPSQRLGHYVADGEVEEEEGRWRRRPSHRLGHCLASGEVEEETRTSMMFCYPSDARWSQQGHSLKGLAGASPIEEGKGSEDPNPGAQ